MARMRGTTAQHVPLETVWSKKSGYSYKFYIKNWNVMPRNAGTLDSKANFNFRKTYFIEIPLLFMFTHSPRQNFQISNSIC